VTNTCTVARTRLVRATVMIAAVTVWFSLSALFADARVWAGQPSFDAHRQTMPAVSSFARFVTEAAQRFDIPERWIRAVMRVESDEDQRSRSPKGAMGLMQIMPATWRDLRARYGLGTNPYDPRDNILAGAAYLREMHDRYGMPGFLAAYNAGPGRYERHLATGWPLPVETRAYVTKLVPLIDGGQIQRAAMANAFAQIQRRATVFVPRPERRLCDDRAASSKRSSGSSRARATIDPSALAPCPQKLFVRHVDEDHSR
jgi:transglycosylase-like protein with SLT domain